MNTGNILTLLIARVILSFPLGLLGKKRLIGYWISFVCFLFLGVGIGLIITLCSPKKDNPNINFEKISHRRRTTGIVFIVLGILLILVTILSAITMPGPTNTNKLTMDITAEIIATFPIGIILLVRSKKIWKKISENP